MRNIQKVFIGIFLSGVLLGGIGTGIALGEFSSLSYGGKKIIGEENLVTKEMDFELPEEGKTVILAYQGYRENWKGSLVEDPSVPAGVIRFQVTYNENVIEPQIYFHEYEQEEISREEGVQETDEALEETSGELFLTTDYIGDDFQIFMENKDKILADLKQKTLSGYQVVYIKEVTVRVNPETKKYVHDNLSRY